jgi:predicted aspartyl protease
MRRILGLLAVAAAVSLAPAYADKRVTAAVEAADPMAVDALLKQPQGLSASEVALLQASAAAMRFDDRAAIDTLRKALAAGGLPRDLRWQMQALLGGVELRANNYAVAAEAFGIALTLMAPDEEGRHALEQTRRVAQVLSGEPGQVHEVRTEGAVAIKRDAANLARSAGRVNGSDQEFVLDTGAGYSTITRSAATRLNLRVLPEPVTVGSVTAKSVPAHLAVADRVEIAGNVFRNAVFLVMEDSALTFAGGAYKIDAILGFPVLARLGRIEFVRADGQETFRVAAPGAARQTRDLYLDILRPMAVVEFAGAGWLRMLLDTGAKHSSLTDSFALSFPALMKGAEVRSSTIGGAGGTKTIEVRVLKNVALAADGQVRRVGTINVSNEGRREHGILGQDVLRADGGFALDFTTMDFVFLPAR